MKITVIGGGPGGLYLALLTKKARPDWDIEVFERNQADDTFGFGVVFSDETLDEFLNRDKPVFERIRDEFAYWDDVAVHFKGQEMRCAGNGFCGTSRQKLLTILQERCAELGVAMTFGTEIRPEELKTLLPIRRHRRMRQRRSAIRSITRFLPAERRMEVNRFCWMGSSRPWMSSTISSARPGMARWSLLPISEGPLDLGVRDGRRDLAGAWLQRG